jgi:hypothetical protein
LIKFILLEIPVFKNLILDTVTLGGGGGAVRCPTMQKGTVIFHFQSPNYPPTLSIHEETPVIRKVENISPEFLEIFETSCTADYFALGQTLLSQI